MGSGLALRTIRCDDSVVPPINGRNVLFDDLYLLNSRVLATIIRFGRKVTDLIGARARNATCQGYVKYRNVALSPLCETLRSSLRLTNLKVLKACPYLRYP